MTQFASLSGVRIVTASVSIPLYGIWAGDVSLATDETVPEHVTLTMGDLSLAGTVYRQASFAGARTCRIVGGAGGWRKSVPKKQYQFSGGVQLSLILKDTALEVGESVNVASDSSVGIGFVRQGGTASQTLHQLAGANWYVDPAGVTQIQAWPSTAIATPFTVISQDGATGVVSISTENYSSWMPGRSFQSTFLNGTFNIGGVTFKMDGDGNFKTEVMTQ